jgi:hypothetical protein
MDFVTLVTARYEESGIDVPERDHRLVATVDGFVAHPTAGPRTRTGPCDSGMLLRADDVPASDGG